MVTKMVTNSATPSIIKCYGVTSEVEIPQTNASINLVLNEVCEFKLIRDPIGFTESIHSGMQGRYSGSPSMRKISESCGLIGRFNVSPVGSRRRNHLL